MQKFICLFIFLIYVSFFKSQSVVINGYFNDSSPNNEWTEILVITDNTDMRNWTLRDNNTAQTGWQTPITFNNIALWNNLRAGTCIIIWHRTPNGITDVNINDGYVEVTAFDPSYFSGGNGNTLDIAGTGDIVELSDASGNHVHALAHKSVVGSDWTTMNTPKLNHANNAGNGDAIYVCPGAVIGDYNGPATGNAFTSKNNSTITFGLPNTCGGSVLGNTNYWNLLREPIFTIQSISPTSSVAGMPGSLTFNWTAATDPNPSDGTVGYIILRNTVNSFATLPADGTTYTNGTVLGSATVIAHINSSSITSYTDNTVYNGNCYYYRVYAYRYTTDNINGNSYHQSRGRAYNTTNFVTVNCSSPLPIELINFKAEINNSITNLSWQTASEKNSSYFDVEKSVDGINFTTITKINAKGKSSTLENYKYDDEAILINLKSYYRLKEVDLNTAYKYSNILFVNTFNTKTVKLNYAPNPTQTNMDVCCFATNEIITNYFLTNTLGQKINIDKLTSENNKHIIFNLSEIIDGYYYLTIVTNQNVYKQLIIKN